MGSGHRRQTRRIVTLASLMLVMSMGAFAQAKIDASQLLTKEEVGQITGMTVAALKTGGDGISYATATYVTAEGSTIVVLVQPSRDAAAAQTVFDRNRNSSKAASGVDPVPVAGLGDRAFWAGGNANTLAVVKGRYWLSVATVLMDNALQPAKRLAAKALTRLP